MAMRRLILISNSTQYGSGYLDYCLENIRLFFSKYDVTKLLFVPYALKDYDAYTAKIRDRIQTIGIEVVGIHEKPDAVQAVNEAEAIFIGGGNTFMLLKTLYEKELLNPIRSRVFKDGMVYMGSSAGTNVATISISTTNDMPICYPPSFEALKLVPFNINPHYIDCNPDSQHGGETREERIKQYHQLKDTPVLGLQEGCILVVEGDTGTLQGVTGAKLFQKDKETISFDPGDDVSFLLSSDECL